MDKKLQSRHYQFLDLFRLFAMLLVMWGHIIGTGAYATEIFNVIQGPLDKPMVNAAGLLLLKPEQWLYNIFHTQAAVLGVVMFFMCTGYLVAGMLERYKPSEFLVNRVLRIIPTLAVCTAINGLILFFSQGLTFSPAEYLSTIFMYYQWTLGIPIMTLLWTLSVEIVFYLCAALLRKFRVWNVALFYNVILASVIASGWISQQGMHRLYNFCYDLRYCSFALLGVCLYLSEGTQGRSRWMSAGLILVSLGLNLIIFRGNRYLYGDTTTYPEISTHLIPLGLFLVLRWLDKKEALGFMQRWKWPSHLASLVYPVYLTHVVVGLNTVYWLSQTEINRYLVLAAGFVASFLCAQLVSWIVEKPSARWSKAAVAAMRRRTAKTI